MRMATMEFAHHRFAVLLSAIDLPDQGETVALDTPLLSAYRDARPKQLETMKTELEALRNECSILKSEMD